VPASDPFHLDRFVSAQQSVYPRVLVELAAGRKQTHWMWFIFPQRSGLGSSPTSVHFAISSLDEARAYLAHPVLGPRLVECTGLVLACEGRTIRQIFGSPDDLKFHSSMSLFAEAAPAGSVFHRSLEKFFRGIPAAR